MSPNLVALLYLVAGVLFILALRGLSSPETSRRGNYLGMTGMAIAVVTTLAVARPETPLTWAMIIAGIAIGGGIGAVVARRIPMTAMPELVAAFHSLVGMAAVLVAAAAFYAPEAFGIGTPGAIHTASLIEMSLGAAIGAITFSRLGDRLPQAFRARVGEADPFASAPSHQHRARAAPSVLCGEVLPRADGLLFLGDRGLSFLLGVLIIVPIGGADMPVVISMLNSYSGWAAAGIGFTLGNTALIVTGALVGSSGAILSYIMCKGMNRSFINVILGGFGGEVAGPAARRGAEAGEARLCGGCRLPDEECEQGDHRAGIRHGGGAGAACAARNGRRAEEGRRRDQICDPSRGGPYARTHERAACGSKRPLR